MPDGSKPANDGSMSERWPREVRERLSSLRLPPAREAEIVDELSQHLDDRYRESIAAGMSTEDAAHAALALFQSGNVLAQQMASLRQSQIPPRITPGAPTGHPFRDFGQDLRYAARTFSKQPGFAAAAVLTLALGIGATTAIFSVVYGVLLKPLPFDEPDRLVSVRQFAPHGAGTNHGRATFLTYRETQQVFEGIGAWDPAEVSITQFGEPERVQALLVSSATLPLLRVQPAIGRFFSVEDEAPGSPLRVILTHGYWQRRFGGARSVVGRRLVIDGTPGEVIGVLPASFTFLRTRPEVLLPMELDVAAPRWISFGFQALARLKPGVTLAQANADVARLISILPPVFARLELQPNVRPLADDVIGNVADILWILLAAVGVVLLIACGNVANLFLVRAEGRHQEFALRAALGANPSRIARALLSESVVLALAGGAVGVGLAQAATELLRRIAPIELPRLNDIDIDAPVLLFTVGVSVVSGILFGLFAVVRFGNPSTTALKEGGRSAGDAPRQRRTRNALVVGQVALALTLLIVSGLMIRTFIAMRQVDPGFVRPQEVQTFALAIPETLISDPDQAARTHERVAGRLAQVPGVVSVGLSSSITMDGENNTNAIEVEEFPLPEGRLPRLRRFKSVAPGYFQTMGIPLVTGRSFTWNEIYERRHVIVISSPLAREYWGEPARALGKRIRSNPGTPWREIVGVVGDERDDGVESATDSDRVLADAERDLSLAHDGLRGPFGTGRQAGLSGRASASGLGGRSEPPAGERPDA
jgi:predicted permease